MSQKTEHPQARAESANLRVLVAEDNALNQDVTRRVLERAGYIVDIVSDGTAALSALQTNAYDVALVDMMMPQVSGLDVIRIHREKAGGDNRLPFIVLTANSTAEAAKLAMEAGADAYLTKPVQGKKLRTTIEAVVAGNGGPMPKNQNSAKVGSSSLDESALIDSAALNQTLLLIPDPGDLAAFMDRFCSDTEGLIAQMHAAANAAQWGELNDLAHALKGSAAYLGGVELAAAAERVQRADGVQLPTASRQHLREIEDIYQRTRAELLRRMAAFSASS